MVGQRRAVEAVVAGWFGPFVVAAAPQSLSPPIWQTSSWVRLAILAGVSELASRKMIPPISSRTPMVSAAVCPRWPRIAHRK